MATELMLVAAADAVVMAAALMLEAMAVQLQRQWRQ